MDDGHITTHPEREDLLRLDAPVLRSTGQSLQRRMDSGGVSLTEMIRRVIGVRYQVDLWQSEGAEVTLWEPTGDSRELRVPNITPAVDEPITLISCNISHETAAALEIAHRADGTPLGETLRRATALWEQVARNQEIGGKVEAVLADGAKRELTVSLTSGTRKLG